MRTPGCILPHRETGGDLVWARLESCGFVLDWEFILDAASSEI